VPPTQRYRHKDIPKEFFFSFVDLNHSRPHIFRLVFLQVIIKLSLIWLSRSMILAPATLPWLSRSVILPNTSLKGFILIIKSTYQGDSIPWFKVANGNLRENYSSSDTWYILVTLSHIIHQHSLNFMFPTSVLDSLWHNTATHHHQTMTDFTVATSCVDTLHTNTVVLQNRLSLWEDGVWELQQVEGVGMPKWEIWGCPSERSSSEGSWTARHEKTHTFSNWSDCDE
jgi:hypothetical protein